MNYKEYLLLLEKDHRKNIIKMGHSEEVADFLHNLNDKYSIWFADKINKMPEYQNSNNKLNFVIRLRDQMQSIIDWVTTADNIIIRNYDWVQALAASIEYHNNLETAQLSEIESNKIIKQYPDGFYWVDLRSSNSQEERNLMGHCASSSSDTLYSLRKIDPGTRSIEAFVTLAVNPDSNEWVQCKGKRNSKPKKEYFPYIVDILLKGNISKYIGEYQQHLDFTNKDFLDYLEENEDDLQDYDNIEEIKEELIKERIDFSKFEELLRVFNAKNESSPVGYFIEEDYGGNNMVYVSCYYNEYIPFKELGISKKEWDDSPYAIDEDLLEKYVDKFINRRIDHTQVDTHNEGINVSCEIRLEDERAYSYTKDGLETFKNMLKNTAEENKSYDREKFLLNFNIILREMGIGERNGVSLILDDVIELQKDDKLPNIKKVQKYQHAKKSNLLIDGFNIETSQIKSELSSYRNSEIMKLTNPYFARDKFDFIKVDETDKIKDIPYYYLLIAYSIFWENAIEKFLSIDGFYVYMEYYKFYIYKKYKLEIKEDENDEIEKYDHEKEMEYIKTLNEKYYELENKFIKFETDMVIPAIENARLITIDDIIDWEVKKDNRFTTIKFKYKVQEKIIEDELTIFSSDYNEENIRYLIKKHLIRYRPIYYFPTLTSIGEMKRQIEELFTDQMQFKEFFENFVKTKSFYRKTL